MSIGNFFLILLNTIVLVSGQFLFKFGLNGKDISFQSVWSIIRLLFSPYIFSGLFLYAFATVLWLFILTRVPLSIAYPIQSIAYILAVFGAYFVFNEPLTFYKILGCIFIMIGVSFIGLAGQQ